MENKEISPELEILKRGVEELYSLEELEAALDKSKKTGKPLKIKYGCDPSAPDIHLGHVVALRKLMDFQRLGHTVQFLIGDFTARIGDPTGRSATRPPLSEEQIRENSVTYQEQVFRVLDRSKTEVVYNSHWLDKLTPIQIVKLCSSYTVARMLERNDFKQRFANNVPIRIHEFLYPLFQGYDSVELNSDVEIGGSDQTFNILVGRELMRDNGQKPQIALTMPILEGLDGKDKMSKSLGNYIAVNDTPVDMFGKVMSVPDALICRYFTLLTDVSVSEISDMDRDMKSGAVNPRNLKARLGRVIVEFFHGADAAAMADQEFTNVFARKELPADMPTITIPAEELDADSGMPPLKLLEISGLVESKAEARRLIRQKAVSLDGAAVEDETAPVPLRSGQVLKVGKRRFAAIDIR